MVACDVKVFASGVFNAERSDSGAEKFVFDYTVTMENLGDVTVTLRSRHWYITDANGHVEEVTGDGVVGQFPALKPRDKYSYSSFAVLATSVGTMHGYYNMITESGQPYVADIPVFRLSNLDWVH